MENLEPKAEAVPKKNKTKNFWFVLLVGWWLTDSLGKWAGDIATQLGGNKDLFGSLFWGDLLSLNLIKILLTAIIVGFSAILYAYLNREKNYLKYLLLGFSIGFFSLVLTLVVGVVLSVLYSMPLDFSALAISGAQADFYITIFILQAVLIGVAVKVGQRIGLEIEYLDDRDVTKSWIYGIKKFYWFLIIFPVNMLITLVLVATTRVISVTVTQIFSGKFSGGFEGLFSAIFFPLFAVLIAFYIISTGVKVIKNDDLSRFNKLIKVLALYVLVPIALFLFIRP